MSRISPGVRFMVTSAFAFSVMSVLVKVVGTRLPSQEIVLARAAVSLALSWWLLARAGIAPWGRKRGLLLLRGTFGFAGLSCVFYSLTHLPLADATVIQYLHPAFTGVLAAIFLGERAGRSVMLCTVLGLTGVLLVAKPALLFGGNAGALDPTAVIVAVGGAFFSACAYVCVRKLGATEHPLVIVLYFPLVTVPASLPTVVADWVWPQGFEWLALLGIGLATQLGQISLTHGMRHEPAGRAGALSYLQVAFAAAWGILLFGERPDAWTAAGALLIATGTVAAARASTRQLGSGTLERDDRLPPRP